MTKRETLDCLAKNGIRYEITEHPAVFNMEELNAVELPYPDRDGKNLFVRDDKDLVRLIEGHGNKVNVVDI